MAAVSEVPATQAIDALPAPVRAAVNDCGDDDIIRAWWCGLPAERIWAEVRMHGELFVLKENDVG